MSIILHIEKLFKSYNKKEGVVINGVDLAIEKGKIVCVVGESGSGKTTLTRLVAGLETQDHGVIKLNDKIVASDKVFIPPEDRKIGMVFQDYALFPHLTVYKNVAYGIADSQDKEVRVAEVLKLVGLEGYANRFPHQLSGGQQQRVALARALAPKPQLLILDEPFSNLDVALKLQLRNEIFDIIKRTNVTAIFVTHDTQDAVAISDEIVVLKKGKIIQQGSSEVLYKSPVDLYVASFFGTVFRLQDDDLEIFGLASETEKHYAVRLKDLQVNTNCTYSTEVFVEKSLFFGEYYLNTVKLSNDTVVNCMSIQKLEGKVTLGIEKNAVLAFGDISE